MYSFPDYFIGFYWIIYTCDKIEIFIEKRVSPSISQHFIRASIWQNIFFEQVEIDIIMPAAFFPR